ncbi:putative secreted protein [[Clostridium] cellulosi]|uniref:Putative secreted protein n=1 Tax=[Clostridium] cellulosi TaxID=29343 RepID=A0A078KLW3_9FIRM|nr:putative secreted protein [[Clostridium] cellulosi]
MKRHIYIFLGLLIIAVAVSLNGCAGFANGIELTLAEKSFSEKADQHNRDVLNYLSKHDAKSLKKSSVEKYG